MDYNVRIEDRAAVAIASVRKEIHQSEIGNWVGEALAAIMPAVGAAGLQPIGPMYCRYHTWAEDRTDCEVGFPISGSAPAGLADSEIPAGNSAVTLHVGPYQEIPAAYEAITTWLENAGKEPGGGPYEVYLNDPNTTPPEQLETEVVWPLT